ncbi:MAG TPA: lipopolysaccharide biosynthesis protein, partial [Myxococcaceae bacterium]|nr:lipopolysaccharide biosynthesis protein [Myxococcaceae bacterium]
MSPTGKSFLGRAGPLVVARLLSSGVTFFIPLILARVMSLTEYGAYKQLFLIFQLFYFVLPFGVAQSLYYFLPRTDARRPYLFQTLVMMLGAGLLAMGLIVATAGFAAERFSNPALWEYRWPLGIYTGCLLGAWPLEISLTSRGKTGAAAKTYLISDSLRAAALVVPVLAGTGLRGLMLANAAFAAGRLLVAWLVVLPGSDGPWWDRSLLVRQIRYAAPFGAAMALNMPQQQLHQFVVSGAVSPELFAIYAVGCFQLPLVDLLYSPTSEVLMVRLGELERSGAWHEGVASFRAATTQLTYCFWPLAAFLFVAAPEFIGALFGAKFLSAVPLFRVSVLAVVLAVLPMDGTLRARDLTGHIFRSYLLKALITVPLVFWAVKHFGMMGGVGSWAATECLGKAVLFARVPQALSSPNHRVGWRDVIPWKVFGYAAGASVAAATAVLALRYVAPGL